ncbi:MAG: hypothetical protein MPEBLZ_04369 [Candidatus Methanoperedens nitroreducens]|uniref:Uncharacterized protein n=1 Tax=Candidatus Methanoperedens nitratireducens TaxID=1392998 RepID=A0A0P8AAX7_9EURY|nr:hypothetical protein [Candidatus Methanoperedens sp. BLZ2]KAB2947524.1 MAG: hypothetical protein F9K14_03710 [Candidatus Methanoperedens sp.]KPQ41086.1 MAG: hypothetical protein MPEBLZ_04369 [Candidatus Methanoperedens sp. BLZ1]MBZ0174380.1 hypothetical protein [Candidatus Methanoperedens nitroreducens]MCX9078766.1 hypothetical protein [Candidatus Methanoperedens sp.]
MLTKTKIIIVFVVLAGLVGTGFLIMQTSGYRSGSETNYLSADFIFNVTDDRELVGFADNVFVGKVIAQTGNKSNTPPPEAGDVPGFSPQTQFSVEVFENIKGNISGIVTMSQEGGYKEKYSVIQLTLIEGDKLLEPGKTYLFAAKFNYIDGWYTLVPAYGDLPIKDQTDHKNKVERFKKAFSQEIPSKLSMKLQKKP